MEPPFIEAEYSDGFVLQEDEADLSPYDAGRNIYHAILNRRPEIEHGKMVRFSLVLQDGILNVDFTTVPDNARTHLERHMEREHDGESHWLGAVICKGIDFGYVYDDEDGVERGEIYEVR
jgi:hypothetical protein